MGEDESACARYIAHLDAVAEWQRSLEEGEPEPEEEEDLACEELPF